MKHSNASPLAAPWIMWVPPIATLGFLAVFGVFAVGGRLNEFQQVALRVIPSSPVSQSEMGARTLWLVIAATGVLTALASCVKAVMITWTNARSASRMVWTAMGVVFVLVVSGMTFLFLTGGLVMGPVSLTVHLIQQATRLDPMPLANIVHYSACVAGGLLTVEAMAIAYIVDKDLHSPDVLRERLGQLRLSLYLCGMLLVLSVAHYYTLHIWVRTLVSSSDVPVVTTVAKQLSLSAGLTFTVLIVALYVPIGVAFNSRVLAFSLEAAKGDPEARTKWLTAHGFDRTPADLAASLAALAAPLLTGVLTQLLN